MNPKHYLITGATSGIGLETARELIANGHRVVVTGRNADALEATRRTLGASAVVLRNDSGNIHDALALGAEIRKHTAVLHGAFLNAGVGMFAPFESVTPDDFDTQFNINVRGLFFQLQSVLPLLNNPSSVVFNASIAAGIAVPATAAYSATKAAVVSLGRNLSVELAPRGIRVNTVSPGPIKTPIFDKLGMPPDAQKSFEDGLAAQALAKRFGRPEEVAKLVSFLMSDAAGYIFGSNFTIDGGVTVV